MASTKLSVRTTDIGVAQAISDALTAAEPPLDAVTLFEDGAGAWRIEAYAQSRADAQAAADGAAGREGPANRQRRRWKTCPTSTGSRSRRRHCHRSSPAASSSTAATTAGASPMVRVPLSSMPAKPSARRITRQRSAAFSPSTSWRARRAFRRVLDLGCGSGVLAIAAARCMHGAQVIATDSDPIAVEVARANADANGARRIATACALGLDHPWLRHAAPFDLIIANILAGPLRTLAGERFAARCAAAAVVILSGILNPEAAAVIAAYARPRLRPHPAPAHRRMVDADAAQAALRDASCTCAAMRIARAGEAA